MNYYVAVFLGTKTVGSGLITYKTERTVDLEELKSLSQPGHKFSMVRYVLCDNEDFTNKVRAYYRRKYRITPQKEDFDIVDWSDVEEWLQAHEKIETTLDYGENHYFLKSITHEDFQDSVEGDLFRSLIK